LSARRRGPAWCAGQDVFLGLVIGVGGREQGAAALSEGRVSMTHPTRTLLVAIEDMLTATTVAAAAAGVAREMGATDVVLAHVLDEHVVLNAMFGAAGFCAPVAETAEDGERLLALAEAAMRAASEGTDVATLPVRWVVLSGDPGAALDRLAAEAGAVEVVVGARRPHAFGRLSHPDTRARLAQGGRHVHVAPLQA